VLAGKFNAHSRQWDQRCTQQWDSVIWENVFDQNGLTIGGDHQATHYWKTEDLKGKLMIVLT